MTSLIRYRIHFDDHQTVTLKIWGQYSFETHNQYIERVVEFANDDFSNWGNSCTCVIEFYNGSTWKEIRSIINPNKPRMYKLSELEAGEFFTFTAYSDDIFRIDAITAIGAVYGNIKSGHHSMVMDPSVLVFKHQDPKDSVRLEDIHVGQMFMTKHFHLYLFLEEHKGEMCHCVDPDTGRRFTIHCKSEVFRDPYQPKKKAEDSMTVNEVIHLLQRLSRRGHGDNKLRFIVRDYYCRYGEFATINLSTEGCIWTGIRCTTGETLLDIHLEDNFEGKHPKITFRK